MDSRVSTNTHLRQAPAIIPVMDLMIGQVVLARNGNRDQYVPVHSKLTTRSDPPAVARALFAQTGCDCLYVADLDSFEGAKPNWEIYQSLLHLGFQIFVDADWTSDDERLERLREKSPTRSLRPIVSTEQLQCERQLDKLESLCKHGTHPIFSIDLKAGKLMARGSQMENRCPRELVREVYQRGIRSLIWLDVASVGTDGGVQNLVPILEAIRAEFADLTLISGGGVRHAKDAQALLESGCQHVLVASAIHQCRFRPDDVAKLGELRATV